jgi:nitric oxide reductase subunit B
MATMEKAANRGLLVSRGWIQAVSIVVVFGFFVLGLLAYRTYRDEPPIPVRTVGETGEVLFTRQDVVDGQGVFLRNGLMEYGSIFGHGAYLGPDFTADYLHRAALLVIDEYGGPSSDQARARTITDFTSNRYNAETATIMIFSLIRRQSSD